MESVVVVEADAHRRRGRRLLGACCVPRVCGWLGLACRWPGAPVACGPPGQLAEELFGMQRRVKQLGREPGWRRDQPQAVRRSASQPARACSSLLDVSRTSCRPLRQQRLSQLASSRACCCCRCAPHQSPAIPRSEPAAVVPSWRRHCRGSGFLEPVLQPLAPQAAHWRRLRRWLAPASRCLERMDRATERSRQGGAAGPQRAAELAHTWACCAQSSS